MARKVNRRTVLNYKTLGAMHQGLVDGLGEVGAEVIARTTPPDAEPFGKGLVTTGDWGVWAGTRKVAGTGTKPRSVRLPRTGATLIVGYGFPGRFQELGTINQPARPFFTPAMLEEFPRVTDALKAPVRRALAGVR
jgi:hypothetical protein